MSDISINIRGVASATLIQKRRVISASSGDASSPALTTRGSNVIPQIGQLPGSERTICGCIGQVNRGAPAATGMGTLLFAAAGFGAARVKKLSGSFLNLSRQRSPQKWYVAPLYSNDPALSAGSTCIPHTGSPTFMSDQSPQALSPQAEVLHVDRISTAHRRRAYF